MFEKKRKRSVDINQPKMDADLDMPAPEEMNEDLNLPGGEGKEIGMQGLKKKTKKRLKVEDTKNGNEVQEGCWQTAPLDIMENIIQRLDLLDRIRGLSILCKYWSSIALRRGIRSVQQFPWLIGTKPAWTRMFGCTKPSPKYLGLEFTIPPDGNVIKLGLSKQNQGRFHSSCKGWLIMVNEENSKVFLLNPISGVKHVLPSLRKIPSFQRFGVQKADHFLLKIALSSSNISECRVAAIFSSMEIGVCRLGKKGWSICPTLDERKESPLCLLFSSCGMLYVLIKNKEIKSGKVISRTLRFGDDHEKLELKLVYDKKEESRKSYSTGGGRPNGFSHVKVKDKSYLIESSTNNEILLIHQFTDHEKNDSGTRMMTHDFLVYKVDLEDGGSFIEVQSLGNQILFVTSRGCSFSLSVSNFTGLEANCIYFAELGVSSYIAVRSKTSMCDFSHHFYLDGQKFGQSREYYYHASPKLMRGLSWFIPSLG